MYFELVDVLKVLAKGPNEPADNHKVNKPVWRDAAQSLRAYKWSTFKGGTLVVNILRLYLRGITVAFVMGII